MKYCIGTSVQANISSFFENLVFYKFWFLVILSFLIGILRPGSIKIERGMKKYFRGLIMRIFGLMGGSLMVGLSLGPSICEP